VEVATKVGREPFDPVNLPRGNGETVLVIDDEASVVTITGETLETFGYRVLTATDGAHGVAVYAKHMDEIDVVITDMMMPVMDGPATTHALKRINPAVKTLPQAVFIPTAGQPRPRTS
jgi:two-component system cell cycle sensor histidine kinase/response regulator CckA